jgi:hypothetical protein
MVKMKLTEQEFIDFMDSKDETAGVYTKEGLKKMYEHFYYFTDDTVLTKIEILENWDEYESLDEAEKDYSEKLNNCFLLDKTIVLRDDSGIVVVKRY